MVVLAHPGLQIKFVFGHFRRLDSGLEMIREAKSKSEEAGSEAVSISITVRNEISNFRSPNIALLF